MKRCIGLCLVLGLCLAALGQEKAGGKAKKAEAKPAAQPAGMPMPKPSPEMLKLIAALSGQWTATMKSEAVMGMPASTSTGPATFSAGPGKLSLMENVTSTDEHGHKFVGHGVTWWDQAAGAYKGIWCDNGTPNGCGDGGTGKWDGDQLVFNGTFDMMGKPMNMRSTYSDIKPGSVRFTMEGGEGSQLQKMFTVEYKKAAPAAKPAAPAK